MSEGKDKVRQLSPYCWRFWEKMVWAFSSHLLYSGGTATLQRYGLGGRWSYKILCKEFFRNVSRWYFVGLPPAFGGRQPRAEAAASPQGWPPPKTSLFIQKASDFQQRGSEWEDGHFECVRPIGRAR